MQHSWKGGQCVCWWEGSYRAAAIQAQVHKLWQPCACYSDVGSDILSAAVEAGEATATAAVLTSCEPGFWLSGAPPVGTHSPPGGSPCIKRLPPGDSETVHYHYGPKDLVTILFYIFITIILHAVVQEYILDKISKRLHLSKVKHSKFNESGQLVVFHLSSVIWCFYVAVTEGYLTNPRSLWEDYPHVYLPFQVKFFYLCQLAYWLHALPELYFQKVRKEEIPRQLQYICLYLLHIAGAYLLNLSRLGLILLLLQYSTEFLFHMARLFYFADENNEKLLCVLLLVCAAQAWLMWRFIHSQLRHWREYWNEQSAKRRAPAAPRLPARLIKRESGYHENGVVKAENGTSPRTKKLKSP
ncbi:hypothetical protein QTO34_001430 [Cnephaeus nilssonii]|uniref:TLC domain-containing protein n=1 Tax=Cnephaeus nilssonii TaxID=3371016 RepID=A0AA40HWN5_CNENI|nr:hypothetical protein QTO34_001430 [Eptesicus nilssonii]